MMKAMMALIACQLVGEIFVRLTHLPIPGPVMGLVLMLGFLLIRRTVPHDLETTSQGLLSHLSLLFVPAGVGIIDHLHDVASQLVPLSVSLVCSTVLGIGVTGLVFKVVHQWTAGYSTDDAEEPSS